MARGGPRRWGLALTTALPGFRDVTEASRASLAAQDQSSPARDKEHFRLEVEHLPRLLHTRRRRGPSPRRSRLATTRRRTSPPSRRTGGSRARRRSAAATRCSSTFHDLPLPRRDCRASLRSGPVAPLPRGAVARHALRCRPLSSFGALLHSSRVMSRSLLISLFYIFPCRRRRFLVYYYRME